MFEEVPEVVNVEAPPEIFREVYCLRKPGKTYDRLLVINNVKILFDSPETARWMAMERYPGHYVDTDIAWPWQRVLTMKDVRDEEWIPPGQVSWFGGLNLEQGGDGDVRAS